MRSLRRILSFVKPYRRDAILALLLLLAVVAAELAIPRLTQRIIDDGIQAGNMSVIVRTTLVMLGASLLSAAFSIVNTVLSVRVAQNTAADIRSVLVRKVQTFSFGNLDRIQTGELIVRSTSDINMVQMIVMMGLRILTRAPLLMVGSIVLLIVTSPRLALLMAVLVPLILVLVSLFATKARPMFQMVQKKLDKLNQVLQENLAGVRVVKAFVRADHENQRFAVANEDYTQQNVRVLQFMSILIPILLFVLNLGVVGAIWFGGYQSIEGSLTVGQIVAFINYLNYAMFPMLMMAAMIGPISAGDASAGRIYEVLDSAPEVQDNAGSQPILDRETRIRGRIAFEHVGFSYNGDGAEQVLRDVNLVAEAGEEVAVLGATGSGKSTLVNLIPRFYDVREGRVTLDGVDVRELPLDLLRLQIGMALQEAVLFSGTIRDNIRYGRPEASDDEVIAAAKAAQAHDFIMDFPDGYDSLVGQRGANLSGGQKQRIAIARALLVQPSVLILDDSTSAVDVETEAKIQEALDGLMKGRTSFVIAQRISTVLNADKIIVLDRGEIAALGTHAELMASSPIYQEIYQSQLGTNGNHHM